MTKENYKHRFCFESYGVAIAIETNSGEILENAVRTAKSALLDKLAPIEKTRNNQSFRFHLDPNGVCRIFQNGESMTESLPDHRFWKYFNSLVRIVVAEHAKSMVFVHAGVVGWRGKAIVYPGNSFYGKTHL